MLHIKYHKGNKVLCFISFFVFLNTVLFCQVKPIVKSFTTSDCDRSCDKEKITALSLKNKQLNIKFVLSTYCDSQFFVTILKSDTDTLKLLINSGNSGFKAGSKQDVFKTSNCLCYYNLALQLSKINSVPKIIIINDNIHHDFLGLIPFDFYIRNRYKIFANNTDTLDYESITQAIGKEKKSKEYANIVRKLGNDSIDYFWNKDENSLVEFPADGLICHFDKLGTLKFVSLENTFIGKLPGGINLEQNVDIIEKKLGIPDKKTTYYGEVYNDNGTSSKVLQNYEYYYTDSHLNIYFEKNGTIRFIGFSNSASD